MIGAILGTVASVAGGILGAKASSDARKRAAKVLDERERRADATYNRDYNQDYTQTATAQNALRKGRDILNEQTSKAEGAKAVMGGTDESVASAKANANDAIADATSSIASNGEALKRQAQSAYTAEKGAIDNARYNNEIASAQQNASAGSQVMSAGMNLAASDIAQSAQSGSSGIDNMFGLGKSAPIYKDPSTLGISDKLQGTYTLKNGGSLMDEIKKIKI